MGTAPNALPGDVCMYIHITAVPGREGDIWLAGGGSWTSYGLWRSTDSGATFTPVSNR